MEGLTPVLQCLQLAGKAESQAVEAVVVLLVWEQRLLYFAASEAAAGAGRLKEQQEVKVGLGEEAGLLVV